MEEFLNMLGERKHRYYHSLYVSKPRAYTKHECLQRIETKIKYDELLTIIDWLPIEQQRLVDKRFDELKQ